MRKLQLRIASFIQNQGIAPSPRKSRLKKTALLFLAAASAAFFVCAQASAIQITSVFPSTSYWNPSNIAENESFMVSVSTDVDFKRVEWTFNGQTQNPDNGTANGPDITSIFTPSFNGLGRSWGRRIKIVATAYDNNNVSVSETMYFRVWSPSNNISILSMSGSSDVVVGELFEADLETNAGFGRVEWYLKKVRNVRNDEKNYGDLIDTAYGPWYKASFEHTFEKGDGSDRKNGQAYRLTAKAYDIANSSGAPVDTDISQIIVNVHEGKKKILRDTTVHVDGFNVKMKEGRKSADVDIYATVGIYYYNDLENATADIYAFIYACKRGRNVNGELWTQRPAVDWFKVSHAPGGTLDAPNGPPEGTKWILSLDRGFDRLTMGSFKLLNAPFVRGDEQQPNHYYGYAQTFVQNDAVGWKYEHEDKDGDKNSEVDRDKDETTSREFPKEWFDGYNSP